LAGISDGRELGEPPAAFGRAIVEDASGFSRSRSECPFIIARAHGSVTRGVPERERLP
jgi:hypothetical protein